MAVDSRSSVAGLSSDPCQRQGWGSSSLGRVPAFPAIPNRTQLVGNCRTLGQQARHNAGPFFFSAQGPSDISRNLGHLAGRHDWT